MSHFTRTDSLVAQLDHSDSHIRRSPLSSDAASSDLKTSPSGIVYIPQSTDDPSDPLNWPLRKKATIVAILFLAMFVGFSAPFVGQLNIQQQAALYGKTPVQITYFVGGFLWHPLSHKFSRSCIMLWTLVGQLVCQVWAPLMTKPSQYAPYLVSRYFSGAFGVTVSVLSPRYPVDMFFLHQRGRAFTILHLALNFGASAGPTIGGFVVAAGGYWTAETQYNRSVTSIWQTAAPPGSDERSRDKSWIQKRLSTFLPCTRPRKASNQTKVTWKETIVTAITPFNIAISPVILMIAGFDTINFGFYVALNALTPVWLQTPLKAGGIYGWNVTQNAAFTFIRWISFLVGLAYGHVFSDRIPLWLVSRSKGKWKPEYRLHALWPTNFVLMPLSLGLVGCAMEYRLHWVIMALGQLFVTIGSLVSIPVTVNYICECFRGHTVEATLVLNSMRLYLGFSINFYVAPWIEKVGVGWVYGMMAFFSLLAYGFLVVLMI
ncbi:major facilitator superfamily domain-containing protein [Rhypophila decipiens]|uniref:Major facilitator superfamily domain-containing protein n=1 Tax=Rhypophila decipiens TaxID=261697 RepID=A0AAN6YDU7_9PEZI|nr:major facilitator superfamily domain-containing protein [Rhypophila decipiens]